MMIRKAKKNDLKELVELDKKANKEISWWTPLTKNGFLKFFRRSNCLYVAEENNVIVGYQSAKIENKVMTLEDLYVKKKFRKKKVGTLLINKVISENKDVQEIKFNCPERLRGFYEKLGFKVASLVMKKRLKQ